MGADHPVPVDRSPTPLVLFALTALVLGADVPRAVSQNIDADPAQPRHRLEVLEAGSTGSCTSRDGEQYPGRRPRERPAGRQLPDAADPAGRVRSSCRPGCWCLSFAVGWWLSGRVLRPVRRITAAAAKIGPRPTSPAGSRSTAPTTSCAPSPTPSTTCWAGSTARSAAQRRLIDDASHELRHPLAVIRTTLDAVLARDDVTGRPRPGSAIVGRAISGWPDSSTCSRPPAGRPGLRRDRRRPRHDRRRGHRRVRTARRG